MRHQKELNPSYCNFHMNARVVFNIFGISQGICTNHVVITVKYIRRKTTSLLEIVQLSRLCDNNLCNAK